MASPPDRKIRDMCRTLAQASKKYSEAKKAFFGAHAAAVAALDSVARDLRRENIPLDQFSKSCADYHKLQGQILDTRAQAKRKL